jgi:hypothetical protein
MENPKPVLELKKIDALKTASVADPPYYTLPQSPREVSGILDKQPVIK